MLLSIYRIHWIDTLAFWPQIQFTMSEQHLLWRTQLLNPHSVDTIFSSVSPKRSIDIKHIFSFEIKESKIQRDIGENVVYIVRMMASIMLLTDVFDVMQCVSDKGLCNISHTYFGNSPQLTHCSMLYNILRLCARARTHIHYRGNEPKS